MRKEFAISLFAGGLFISGCSTIVVEGYSPPVGPNRSEITFKDDGIHGLNVFLYKGSDRCTRRLGRFREVDNKITTYITTEDSVAFSTFIGASSVSYCENSASLKADPSKIYNVSVHLGKNNNTCFLEITEADISGSGPEHPAHFQVHKNIDPGGVWQGEAGPFCKSAYP